MTSSPETHVKSASDEYGVICGRVNDLIVMNVRSLVGFGDHPLIKHFGEYFVRDFDTFTTGDTDGNLYLWFLYDNELSNTITRDCKVSFSGDRQYVMGPGSIVMNARYVKFETINNKVIKRVPSELKDWMLYE